MDTFIVSPKQPQRQSANIDFESKRNEIKKRISRENDEDSFANVFQEYTSKESRFSSSPKLRMQQDASHRRAAKESEMNLVETYDKEPSSKYTLKSGRKRNLDANTAKQDRTKNELEKDTKMVEEKTSSVKKEKGDRIGTSQKMNSQTHASQGVEEGLQKAGIRVATQANAMTNVQSKQVSQIRVNSSQAVETPAAILNTHSISRPVGTVDTSLFSNNATQSTMVLPLANSLGSKMQKRLQKIAETNAALSSSSGIQSSAGQPTTNGMPQTPVAATSTLSEVILERIEHLKSMGQNFLRAKIGMPDGSRLELNIRPHGDDVRVTILAAPIALRESILKDWKRLSKKAEEKGINLKTPTFLSENIANNDQKSLFSNMNLAV